MLGAAFLGGEDAELPFSFEPIAAKSLCAAERNDAVVLAMQQQERALDLPATPSSVNFFDHSSAVDVVGGADHQRNWKVEEAPRARVGDAVAGDESWTLQCMAPNAMQAA